jgi:hypothetical protein
MRGFGFQGIVRPFIIQLTKKQQNLSEARPGDPANGCTLPHMSATQTRCGWPTTHLNWSVGKRCSTYKRANGSFTKVNFNDGEPSRARQVVFCLLRPLCFQLPLRRQRSDAARASFII